MGNRECTKRDRSKEWEDGVEKARVGGNQFIRGVAGGLPVHLCAGWGRPSSAVQEQGVG